MKQTIKLTSIFVILMLVMTTMASAIMYAPPQPIQKITIQIDKTVYQLGDPVIITVNNNLNQPIYFDAIMVKNLITKEIINTDVCGGQSVACADVAPIGPIKLDSGKTYTVKWYPTSKGYYLAYVDWWAGYVATCQSTECPPANGISGRAISNAFWVR